MALARPGAVSYTHLDVYKRQLLERDGLYARIVVEDDGCGIPEMCIRDSAKLCAGQMTRIACAQKGIQHVWARILSVYGPYDLSLIHIL